jgi:hypothetical protein
VKIPRTQLARVAALEARVASSKPSGSALLEWVTDAELDELEAYLLEVTPPCPACGLDRRQEPDRHCHHAQAPLSWPTFRPVVRARMQELDRLAAERLRAAAESRRTGNQRRPAP